MKITDQDFEYLIIDTLGFDWHYEYSNEYTKWIGIMSILKTIKILSCKLGLNSEQFDDITLLFLIAANFALKASKNVTIEETLAILKQQNA